MQNAPFTTTGAAYVKCFLRYDRCGLLQNALLPGAKNQLPITTPSGKIYGINRGLHFFKKNHTFAYSKGQ